MLNRRYQIYICASQELEAESQALAYALLRLRCIPAGRQFLAEDASWSDVRAEINSSDYVLVLNAARYGTLLENGISRAHRDYTYACSRGKPVFSLLSEQSLERSEEQQESTAEGRARLLAFRRQLRRHKCATWENGDTLLQQVQAELPGFIRENAAPGWRRSSQAQALAALTRTPPKLPDALNEATEGELASPLEGGADDLAGLQKQLDERYELAFRCNLFIAGNCHLIQQRANLPLRELFLGYATALQSGPCSEERVQLALASLLEQRYRRIILQRKPEAHAVDSFSLQDDARRKVRQLLQRLELIGKERPDGKHKALIWSLTPLAHTLLLEFKKRR